MVGRLKWFSRDPNGRGRGAGYYYHRGHGYYSKYSVKRDRGKRARHGDSAVGRGAYKHTHDWRDPKLVWTPWGRIPRSLAEKTAAHVKKRRRKRAKEYVESDYFDIAEYDALAHSSKYDVLSEKIKDIIAREAASYYW